MPVVHAAHQATARQAAGTTASIADPGDINVGTVATLDGSGSTGSGLSFTWEFGDGTTGTGARVQHTYARVDDYTVTLDVRDQNGATSSTTRTVRVVPNVQTFTGRPALGQIVPASQFTGYLALTAPGPATLSVRVGGAYLSSDRWDYTGGDGPMLFEVPSIQVANEDNADIAAQVIDTVGGTLPLVNNVNVTVTYPVSGGSSESATYALSLLKPADAASVTADNGSGAPGATPSPTPSPSPVASSVSAASPTPAGATAAVYDQAPGTPTPSATPAASSTPAAAPAPPSQPAIWSITYPTYLPVVGRPANEDDVNDYYLTGDRQFHHGSDPLVRRFALKIARAGGVFPDDPKRAADNIYNYVHGLLGIGDPGELQTDQTILDRVLNGVLVPGARDGTYICIAHAYFLSSLTRTLGLPTREETVAFGRGVDQDSNGAWIMNYYQEGANEVWYDGAWHHYDTWIGTKDRSDYLSTNLTEIAWYAFSEQATPFTDVHDQPVGLAGHDFSLGKYTGTPGSPDQWRFLEQQTRPGITIAPPGPDAYQSADKAAPYVPGETVSAGILNPAPSPAPEQ